MILQNNPVVLYVLYSSFRKVAQGAGQLKGYGEEKQKRKIAQHVLHFI